MITYMSFMSLLCLFFNSDVSAGIKSIIIIYDYNNIGGTYSQLPTSAKM